jgi:signal transduction histidine kinase
MASSGRGGVPQAGRDLLVVALFVVIANAIAALLLTDLYFPSRRDEALARAPAQLTLLARDRQNALTGWVRERISNAVLGASLLAEVRDDQAAPELLDRLLRAYGYESAFVVADSGAVVLRRGSGETDDASAVLFARETMKGSGPKIDFRRAGQRPKVFTASSFTRHDGSRAAVLFVSDPYDYVYPLFSTATVASRTAETNLVGLYDGWGVGLNPYPDGRPPPMTLRLPIPKEFELRALGAGERSIQYTDRRGMAVIGVVKAIPQTPWVLVAKIDRKEVLEGAVAETWRLGVLLAVVSLVLATAAFVMLRSRRMRELRAAEDRLRNLSARLLRVQDDERRRLARELHDTVGQNLSAVRMNLGVMKRFSANDDRTAAAVDDSITATDDVISQVRTLSYLLHPPMIDQAGLLTALRWYIDGFERRSGITTKLEVPEDLGRLSRDVETSVFRIIQESLTNIQRHAGSATASVSLDRLDDELVIEIADHGRGLPEGVRDDRDALLASGVGIAAINERVRELGGEMTIQSTNGGTTLRATLPAGRADEAQAPA